MQYVVPVLFCRFKSKTLSRNTNARLVKKDPTKKTLAQKIFSLNILLNMLTFSWKVYLISRNKNFLQCWLKLQAEASSVFAKQTQKRTKVDGGMEGGGGALKVFQVFDSYILTEITWNWWSTCCNSAQGIIADRKHNNFFENKQKNYF